MTHDQIIWESKAGDPAIIDLLSAELRLPEPVARVLVHRGIADIEAARKHLDGSLSEMPDPFLLKGMKKATARIEKAIQNGESIVAWGDYDVDGITSLALLVRFFAMLSIHIRYEIPDRMEEGYGLKAQSVERLVREGASLIITVDNGISSLEAIKRAGELGVDVIVVDHHLPEDELPEACAIIDPKQEACNFPYDNLAAAGLTFMLIAGLRRHLVETGLLDRRNLPNLKELLDIVALGTVADMVPLLGLNRLLVRHGLPILSRSKRTGILALKEVCALDADAEIDAYTIAFQLAPRINAGGRLGDAMTGVKLLVDDELDAARQQAYLLNKRNMARRKIEEGVLREAFEMLEDSPELLEAPVLVLAREGWHEGVIGLAASRLVERYHKPAIVICVNEKGIARGSCRSIRSFHIQQALSRQKQMLVRFGGHAQAAGLTIEAKKIAAFREALIEDAADRLSEEDFIPRLHTDGELPLESVEYGLLDFFERLAPFGIGNPAPLFTAEGVLVSRARLIKEKHWKLGLNGDGRVLEAIGFNMAKHEISKGDRLDIAYIPEYNNYRGQKSVQLRLKDVRRID